MPTLYVVPAERHVERLAKGGQHAETRSSLRARLAAALLPDTRFADAREARLTLGIAIEEFRGAQLGLFDAGASPDPLLAQLRGPSWVRAIAAIDDAIGALRARGIGEPQLERAAKGKGVAAARARTLSAAMRALDQSLAPARDERLLPFDLAAAIRAAGAARVREAVGAPALRARWLLAWNPDDLAWWRALDDVLGDARIILPWFDKKLEGSRERDPLEIVADAVLKGLEAAPETELIPPVLGDLASVPPSSAEAVRIGKAADASEQARLVAAAIAEALAPPQATSKGVISFWGQAPPASAERAGMPPTQPHAPPDQSPPQPRARREAEPNAERAPIRTDAVPRRGRGATGASADPEGGATRAGADPVGAGGANRPGADQGGGSGPMRGGARPRGGRGATRAGADAASVDAALRADADPEGGRGAESAPVEDASRAAVAVERIVIAYPSRDERTLRPLRRELAARGIVFHDAMGPPPSEVPVVAAALLALHAAESKDRVSVARLLRSGYVDAPRALASELSFRDAERVLDKLARALQTRATAPGATPIERLIATAGDDEHARRIASLFQPNPKTRVERVRAARRLFHELGIAARAGRGALGTFARDEAPAGVDRAERLAVARDVRAGEVLEDALDAYEAAALRRGSERAIDAEVFLLELGELLDASGQLPGAGRAGAVRITRLADVAGDELDLLIVVDANDGVLPRDARPLSLVTESLEERVKLGRDPGEHAARELAALASAAAEAKSVLFVTTADDASDAPAMPARVVVAALRAGATTLTAAPPPMAVRSADVARRAMRERIREGFFLDPRRPESDVVGALATTEAIAAIVGPETGADRERPLAVTSIERFAQCAFKGYAHAILAAREGEEQRELPDAREEGNLGHSALAAAFLATRVEWPLRPRDRARILTKGLAAAEEALAAAAGHAPLRAIVRLRIRESVRAVLLRALDDETWDFALAEQPFGPTRASGRGDVEAWPPFDAGGGALWLRGSVDRIDRAHDGARVRVIDYKRSKSTAISSMASVGEAAIQVPLYAAIAARNLRLGSTGLYLPTQPRDLALTTAPRAKEDRVADLAAGKPSPIEERVVELARAARKGSFTPIPIRETECTHCSMSGGCRKPRFAMAPEEDDPTASDTT